MAPPPKPSLENREYTVGWITALPTELAAAKAMLDEVHKQRQWQHPSDKNIYTLGRINTEDGSHHNVVVACLPEYGTTSAATVASQMISSFDSIRIGLMVGIGGGAPSTKADIRLGDIVVSKPEQSFGGVVQYDSGKTGPGGKIVRTGSLNKPPQVLLNAVSTLRANHDIQESKVPYFLSKILQDYPTMKRTGYIYQGTENDLLYKAEYTHMGGEDSCDSCDVKEIIHREPRDCIDPVIHYGVIASGNQVIKDAMTRDQYRRDLGVLCFEMEAAGLMNNFPCLVVRGICDYSDSHKNKRWQKYAAAAAAAYAKELLEIIPPAQVDETHPAVEALKS